MIIYLSYIRAEPRESDCLQQVCHIAKIDILVSENYSTDSISLSLSSIVLPGTFR